MSTDGTVIDKESGAAELVHLLEAWGVRHIFTCPGSTEAAFLKAASASEDIELILTTHEAIAVSMADGRSRVAGSPSIAYLHTNVGLTNGLSYLFAAKLAHSPVVVLNGLKSTAIQNRGGFTTTEHMRDFVRQYVKSDWQVLSPTAVLEDVNRALKISTTEPQGPTWVGLSQDLLEAPVPRARPDAERSRVPGRTRPARQQLEEAARVLSAGTRVLIVAGAEARTPEDVEELRILAEILDAAVVEEDRRTAERLVFPTGHRSYAGRYSISRQSVSNADVVFLAGARSFIEFEPVANPDLPASATLIHLYPDPAELGKLYGTDIPLAGTVAETLHELNEILRASAQAPARSTAHLEAAVEENARLTAITLERPPSTAADAGDALSVREVMLSLPGTVPSGVTVIADAITSNGLVFLAAEQMEDVQVLASASGSLGWGVGAALGAQLGDPNRRVLAVLGDGGFQFGLPGLWTAARYDIPTIFLVINNQSYAAVGAAVRRFAGTLTDDERASFVDLSGADLAAIASGFGIPGVRARTLSELSEALREAFERRGPSVIEVMTDPVDLGP